MRVADRSPVWEGLFIRFAVPVLRGRLSFCEFAFSFSFDLRVGCGIRLYKFLIIAFFLLSNGSTFAKHRDLMQLVLSA